MTHRKIRWGVIGSGGIARRRTIPEGIMPASNAVLTAVYNPTRTTNEAVAREFGAVACGSVEQLLASDVDAVYIASPPHVHLEQTRLCAAAGKHVLCEKPLGLTVPEVEAMIAACAAAGVRLGTAFMMRFHAQHRAALELIREGAIGKPVFGRAQLSCWYPPLAGAWRQRPETGGGGSLIDMGGHCIDLLEMFLGPAKTVSCLTQHAVHGYATEDSAVVALAFASGALGTVDAFFCTPDEASQNRLEIYGSKGSILARDTLGQESRGQMTAILGGGAEVHDPRQARAGSGGREIDPAPVNTYRAEIEEFGGAILEPREPVIGAALGLRSQRVLAACYESAAKGVHVSVA